MIVNFVVEWYCICIIGGEKYNDYWIFIVGGLKIRLVFWS